MEKIFYQEVICTRYFWRNYKLDIGSIGGNFKLKLMFTVDAI